MKVPELSVELNPNFELERPILSPTNIKGHINELKSKIEPTVNAFPVDVFPTPIQEIINETHKCLNFPIDFIAGSILYAVSVATGNTHRVEIMRGWREGSVLFISIVGRPGTNKSHPVSFALNPIEKRDNQRFQSYLKEKIEYDLISKLSKKEREKQGYGDPKLPIWEQILVTDFTPEAITDIHKDNQRGIGVYADELASWFKNFNRYNNGSEEQLWLSVWSGKPIRINRKTSDPIYIPLPFISVAGTIQPGVLNELAEKRTENGFIDRLLFVLPDNLKKEYWNENELNPKILKNWDTIISKLLDLSFDQDGSNDIQPKILKFTPKAKQLLFNWQKELTDQFNMPENEEISGIYAKIEMYAARLALCLEMAHFACNNSDKNNVGIEAVKGALKLVDYFKHTALKVHSIIFNENPIENFPTNKKALYSALPEIFTTSEGLKLAGQAGIAERTFKRFLTNRELFNNHKRGEYEKRY